MKNKACIFAGSFDPITLGHIEVVNKCLTKYKKVFVVVGENGKKTPFFTDKERLELVKKAFEGEDRVVPILYADYKNEYYDFLLNNNARVYVRGIRNKKDKEYELKQKKLNKNLYPKVKTKFINCSKKYRHISSSMVKERLLNGKGVEGFVPSKIILNIQKLLQKKTNNKTNNS